MCVCRCCSPHAITGVSTYNVVPDKADYYFNKIQCFCFEEQRLRAGEKLDMVGRGKDGKGGRVHDPEIE